MRDLPPHGTAELPPHNVALSTMYFQRWPDQSDLAPFFALGTKMGFPAFELSHILSPPAVATVDPDRVRIAAVHHPCPLSADCSSHDRLTSADPAARERAAALIRATLETAARLRAPVVVLHLGYVEDTTRETIRKMQFELESRYQAGQRDSPRYQALLANLLEHLAHREAAHLERAMAALPTLLATARDLGVSFGLETGHTAQKLPRPTGMVALLDALGSDGLGAWLDTGHVGRQQHLGLASFDDWFEAVGSRWLGVHLHDIVGLRDHLIPGHGGIDFAAVARKMPPAAVRSMEVDWYFAPEEVSAGLRYVVEAGCG